SGTDNAEKMRNFIIDAYNDWETEYVLLGGDTNYIPSRSLYVSAYDGIDRITRYIPSDYYFQCLDGDFNYDGDSKWGEPFVDGVGGGDVDLLSEVFIGRASASSASEFANFVYKVITYENNTDVDRGAMYLGENADSSSWGCTTMKELKSGTSNHGFTTVGVDYDASWTAHELYECDGGWSSSTAKALINANEISIINAAGHGSVTSCAKFSTSTAASLTNTTNFPFMYTCACSPGAFTSGCIAESFTTSSRTSMIGGIWNSVEGFYQYNNRTDIETQYVMRYMWDHFFAGGVRQMGKMNAFSHETELASYSGNGYSYFVAYETNLFGDPHTSIVYHDALPDCNDDSDCDDGNWCNGTETCVAEHCVDGSEPCPGQSCNGTTEECLTESCYYDEDSDGDNDVMQEPGGTTCWRRCPMPQEWDGTQCTGSVSSSYSRNSGVAACEAEGDYHLVEL
ncbi:MAG: hypothetical protein GY833_09545, partial [Aestuariibacter sp.]|nr:hypothetical protein [Aestuariibacter sp.]